MRGFLNGPHAMSSAAFTPTLIQGEMDVGEGKFLEIEALRN